MKPKTALVLGLFFSSATTSCLKSPTKPNMKAHDKSEDMSGEDIGPGEAEGSNPEPPEVEAGNEIKNGKDSSGYQNLTCSKVETRRGIRAWRRLSNAEIINTAKDVFGVTDAVDFSSLNSDTPKKGLFDTVQTEETFMDLNRLKGYDSFAQEVVKAIDMNRFFPCIATGENCVSQKIAEIGTLAWRRPFTAEDTKLFTDLYKNLIADGATPASTLPYLLQGLILSPDFMYRTELGTINADSEFELTSYEIASALSYLIWRRPPDAQLRSLAEKDSLKTSEAIADEAKRLFASPNAKAAMEDFGDMWFDGKNIVATVKADLKFTTAAKSSMQGEVRAFVANLMLDPEKGTFEELLNASSTPGDASTSFVYGAMPDAGNRIPYREPQRRGILGQAAFLASHAFSDTPNPITRGAFVSKRLLCMEFGMVKNMEIPEQKPGLSNKERFQVHSQNPACSICHAMIDPFGFAMENFDSSGMFRMMDSNKPIVIDSKFRLDDKAVMISTPQELYKAIAQSRQGLECYARQAFRYSFGRMEFVPRMMLGGVTPVDDSVQRKLDQCEIDTVTAQLQSNGGKLQNALIAMISSPAFRLRLKSELPAAKSSLHLSGDAH